MDEDYQIDFLESALKILHNSSLEGCCKIAFRNFEEDIESRYLIAKMHILSYVIIVCQNNNYPSIYFFCFGFFALLHRDWLLISCNFMYRVKFSQFPIVYLAT